MKNVTIAVVLGCILSSAYFVSTSPDSHQKTESASILQRARRSANRYPAAVGRSYKKANSQACTGNLRQIGTALNIFVMDNNRLPAPNGVAGLKKLAEQQNLPWSIFCCPARRPAQLDEKSVAFLYLGATAAGIGGKNLPTAIEKPNRHGNNCAVLFADGSVRSYTISGTYTSVKQVVALAVPQANRTKYIKAIEQLEKIK